jgi:hypothetical protein
MNWRPVRRNGLSENFELADQLEWAEQYSDHDEMAT